MNKKIKTSIGKALSSSISLSESDGVIHIKLSGKALLSEPLGNESVFVNELAKAGRNIDALVAANTVLGTFTIQWLTKLQTAVIEKGNSLKLSGLNAKNEKFISILGANLSA
jgi:hypothetical protein